MAISLHIFLEEISIKHLGGIVTGTVSFPPQSAAAGSPYLQIIFIVAKILWLFTF